MLALAFSPLPLHPGKLLWPVLYCEHWMVNESFKRLGVDSLRISRHRDR
jgi:hypothetical protein